MNNNGTAEWRGELEDCSLVYCSLPDEFGREATATAKPISYGNAPNVSALGDIIKFIPTEKKKLGIFYENAQVLYRCIKGHAWRDSLQFTLRCKLPPREFGQARWEPIESACTRMSIVEYELFSNNTSMAHENCLMVT